MRVTLVLVGLELLTSCHRQEPPRLGTSGEARIALLQEQISAMRSERPRWDSWLADLRKADSNDHEAEVFLRRGTAGLLWDAGVLDRVADPTAAGQSGPVSTIVSLSRQLKALDVELLVMPIPPVQAIYPDLIGLRPPLRPGETLPLLDFGLREFHLRLEEHGIEVLDLLPVFSERRFHSIEGPPKEPGPFRELLFRRQDIHWTSYGASVAAEEVADRLRRYPWFDEVSRRFGQGVLVERSDWLQRLGPIARRMVEEGRLDPDTPGEHFLRRQVSVEGERWSVSERASPILFIGDSFLAPQHGFSDHLLKELGFRTDSIVVPGGVPGNLNALRLRGDALDGKKLVVLEFVSFALNRIGRWQPVPISSGEG